MVLIIFVIFEFIYFYWLKRKGVNKLTKEQLLEKERIVVLAKKGEADYISRQKVIKDEISGADKIEPFSQPESCYIFPQGDFEEKSVYKGKVGNLIQYDFEGILEQAGEFTDKGCNYFKLKLSYVSPYEILLPNDIFLKTNAGETNGKFLGQYLGRRIRLGFSFEEQGDNLTMKEWRFTRFYVQ